MELKTVVYKSHKISKLQQTKSLSVEHEIFITMTILPALYI